MNELPDYMKICYLALFNTTTEIAYEVLKEQEINAMPYLTKLVKILSTLSIYTRWTWPVPNLIIFTQLFSTAYTKGICHIQT